MVQSTGQQISSCFYRPEVVQTCQMSNRQLIGEQEESRGSATGGMGVQWESRCQQGQETFGVCALPWGLTGETVWCVSIWATDNYV